MEPPLCAATYRGGVKHPPAPVFAHAARESMLSAGSATRTLDIPFHTGPRVLTQRDVASVAPSSPQQSFSKGARFSAVGSLSAILSGADGGGPGAYDVADVSVLSTRPVHGVTPFGTGLARDLFRSEPSGVGPGGYRHTARGESLTRERPATIVFGRESRTSTLEASLRKNPFPAMPLKVSHAPVLRSPPRTSFLASRGHEPTMPNPATAAVPLRSPDRPRKRVPGGGFGTARRF